MKEQAFPQSSTAQKETVELPVKGLPLFTSTEACVTSIWAALRFAYSLESSSVTGILECSGSATYLQRQTIHQTHHKTGKQSLQARHQRVSANARRRASISRCRYTALLCSNVEAPSSCRGKRGSTENEGGNPTHHVLCV